MKQKIILIILMFSFIPLASAFSITFCSETSYEYNCGDDDGICPSEFDPLKRYCEDPDCNYYLNPLTSIDICGDTYSCGDDDGICPSDFDPDRRECNICDPDCGCKYDCSLSDVEIEDPGYLVKVDDPVIFKGKITGSDCPSLENIDFKVEVISEKDECTLLLNSNELKVEGEDIEGTWYAKYSSQCVDTKFETDGGDVARVNFQGLTLYSTAEGGFTTAGQDVYPPGGNKIVVHGNVFNETKDTPLKGAKVLMRSDTERYEFETFESGIYNFQSVKEGEYMLTFSKKFFEPKVLINEFRVGDEDNDVYNINVTLSLGSSQCQSDCTIGSSVCNSDCEGWNGCEFYNFNTMDVCNTSTLGHSRNFNDTHNVYCCSGAPIKKSSVIPVQTKIPSSAENVITTTRIVNLDGVPVKMNVVVVDKT